jgi:FkbM family methyltransferase
VSDINESELIAEVDKLLREDPSSVQRRERAAFDEAVAGRGRSLVLFGAGGLGRKTLAGLRQVGVEPLAFADNNPELWGKSVGGLPVLSLPDAGREYGRTAAFVCTIWRGEGTDTMESRTNQLRAAGCTVVVPFGPLFWKYPEVFVPHYSFDFPDDLLELRSDEQLIDCGAFDGDTVRAFLKRQDEAFASVDSFEPDPANFKKLEGYVSNLRPPLRAKVRVHPCAVGSRTEIVRFNAQANEASFVGAGELEVRCVDLDHYLAGRAPTYIKMDIEGFEPEALQGASGIIRQHAPVLAICVYHKQDHVWRLPLLMRSLSEEYRLYLRPHLLEVWDLVCYAVPHARLLPRTGQVA